MQEGSRPQCCRTEIETACCFPLHTMYGTSGMGGRPDSRLARACYPRLPGNRRTMRSGPSPCKSRSRGLESSPAGTTRESLPGCCCALGGGGGGTGPGPFSWLRTHSGRRSLGGSMICVGCWVLRGSVDRSRSIQIPALSGTSDPLGALGRPMVEVGRQTSTCKIMGDRGALRRRSPRRRLDLGPRLSSNAPGSQARRGASRQRIEHAGG